MENVEKVSVDNVDVKEAKQDAPYPILAAALAVISIVVAVATFAGLIYSVIAR